MNRYQLKETWASHRDGDIRLKIYENTAEIPYHWHDEYEFIYITSGKCLCSIEDVTYIIESGSGVLIKGGLIHALSRVENLTYTYFAIVFHPYMIYGTECRKFFLEDYKFNSIFSNENAVEKTIINLLKSIYFTYKQKPFAYELYLKADLTNIFCKIFKNRLYIREQKTETKKSLLTENILNYIHKNYAENFSIYELSREIGYSKSYIMHNFKEYTGKTVNEYLTEYRIYIAKQLLEDTEKSILEIALECGFNEASYFIRIFKRQTGISPLKYRGQNKRSDYNCTLNTQKSLQNHHKFQT